MMYRTVMTLATVATRGDRGAASGTPPLEHAEHPVRDEEAADHVDHAEGDRDPKQDVVERPGGRARREHQGADQHDPVDRVGPRHQRGVQGVGHLGDHGEADEAGQHQDREVGQEHQASFSSSSDSDPDSDPGPDPDSGPDTRVTQDFAMISSEKSGATFPSTTISSRSASTFRAYSSLACSGMVAGRFSGAAMVTPSTTTTEPGTLTSQFPLVSPAKSTTTLPGRIERTASAVTSFGAGRPGTSAVVITTSNFAIASVSAACCASCSAAVKERAYPPSPEAVTPRSSHCAPSDLTCSATSGRTSKPVVRAPSRRAVASACRPATPTPS